MQNSISTFSLRPPLLYAWLFRSDVRGTRRVDDADGQKGFLVWWALEGAKEYGLPLDLADDEKAVLFQPLCGATIGQHFGMCRLLLRLLQIRTDVADRFDLADADGVLAALAWFFAHGLREHGLLGLVDSATLRELDEPPPFLTQQHSKTVSKPKLTWLMFFVWQSRPDLQKSFDISDEAGQQDFLNWFFAVGLEEFSIWPLVAERWRQWLLSPVAIADGLEAMSRIAVLVWQKRGDLQEAFDLNPDIS